MTKLFSWKSSECIVPHILPEAGFYSFHRFSIIKGKYVILFLKHTFLWLLITVKYLEHPCLFFVCELLFRSLDYVFYHDQFLFQITFKQFFMYG